MRGSREISLVPSLHRASTDALILMVCCCGWQLWLVGHDSTSQPARETSDNHSAGAAH